MARGVGHDAGGRGWTATQRPGGLPLRVLNGRFPRADGVSDRINKSAIDICCWIDFHVTVSSNLLLWLDADFHVFLWLC